MLNGKENISDETYTRIMHAVNELNYRPNLLARSLKKNNTKFIAVLLPRIEDHYSKIMNGVQRILGEKGYRIILELTDDNSLVEQEIVENMLDIGVNGMLIVPATPVLSEAHLKARSGNVTDTPKSAPRTSTGSARVTLVGMLHYLLTSVLPGWPKFPAC